MKGQQRRLLFDTLILGVVGALSAQLFVYVLRAAEKFFLQWIAGYRPPGLPQDGGVLQQVIGPHGLLLIPLATTLGGLISGALVYTFAPEAEGHGTDTAVKAYHYLAGFIRGRIPPLKMVASAITIGSGGSAGREGPTALISAGIGSLLATVTHRPDDERRLLVLVGMAAGLSAIFRSPIGTAFFAIEVLYRDMEFDAAALSYTMIASVVAYVINGLFVGWQPLFYIPANLNIPQFREYAWYVALGIASGIVATILPVVFYGVRDLFQALPIPPHFKPALGGLGVGLLALELPQVLGGGYGWIQEAINGRMAADVLLMLLFAKMAAFALTVSSGGSGGVFAPSLFVGAMLGGSLGEFFGEPAAPFVVVGMAAVFGGAARVPIATLLMVTEMTGGYHLLVPAALAVTLSYMLQVILSASLKYKSLYEAQVESRSDSPAHHAEHLRRALELLVGGQIADVTSIGPIDLMALLNSGIAITLPEGRLLIGGRLRAESSWVGKAIQAVRAETGDALMIVAVVRERHLLSAPDTPLQPADQVIAISSGEFKEQFAKQLGPISPPEH